MESFFIHNAIIVNEGKQIPGSLIISGGRIEEIFYDRKPESFLLAPDTIEIDARGRMLMPGVIDDQVH